MVYYGVSLNVNQFHGNLFVNNAVFGAVELPAYVLCVPLLKWGRKRAVQLTLLIVGLALVALQFMQNGKLSRRKIADKIFFSYRKLNTVVVKSENVLKYRNLNFC